MTRHRLIWSVTGAATLAAALGLLGSAYVTARGSGVPTRAPSLSDAAHGVSAPARAEPTRTPGEPVPAPGESGREVATAAVPRSEEPAVDPTATVSDRPMAASPPMEVTVYYLRPVGGLRYLAPERHQVPFAPAPDGVAASAVSELLGGTPRYLGAARPFPSGTRLLDLGLDAGTATVNLSRQALGAASGDGYPVQALVWTVTQLPQVKRVVVQVEGRSAGTIDGQALSELLGVGAEGGQLVRDPGARLAPILLAEPVPRATVDGSRVVAKGQARVATDMVGLRLHNRSGQVVSQSYAALPSSVPGWAAFSGALTFNPPSEPELWTVEAFETSPTDASVTYSVAVPVWVGG